MIEVDGNYEEGLNKDIEAIAEIVTENLFDVIMVEDSNRWMSSGLRRCIGEAVKSISEYKEEDKQLCRDRKFPRWLKVWRRYPQNTELPQSVTDMQATENVHVNILKIKLDSEMWEKKKSWYGNKGIFTWFLSGTISGKHGIGYSQKSYLPIASGNNEINHEKNKVTLDQAEYYESRKIFPRQN